MNQTATRKHIGAYTNLKVLVATYLIEPLGFAAREDSFHHYIMMASLISADDHIQMPLEAAAYPSKSALYGVHTHSLNRSVRHCMI